MKELALLQGQGRDGFVSWGAASLGWWLPKAACAELRGMSGGLTRVLLFCSKTPTADTAP